MNGTHEVLTLLGACLPLFSSLIWMLMIVLSVHDSRTRLERRIKNTILWYYIFMAVVWISMLLYTYAPPLVLWLNIPAYLAYMLAPIQFYRYICELSETLQLKPFSLWHYALPVLIVSILGIWSFFVPWDVQTGLVESRGQISSEYPAYSRYFLSKPMMRVIFVTVYTILSLLRIRRYYRIIGRETDKYSRPAHWVMGLMGLVSVMLLITVPSALLPRGEIITSWLVLAIAFFLVGEDFIIGYNVICRNFLLYIPSVKERMDKIENGSKKHKREAVNRLRESQKEIEPVQSSYTGVKLTKKRFEDYIKSCKSWLDPNLKITNLVSPLDTNRTTLSNFINKTYGVNFNRYINRLRLAELDRLMSLSSNAGKTVDDLLYKAGFATKRNYMRAKEAEQNNNPNRNSKDTAGKENAK